MIKDKMSKAPWVVVRLKKELYGISADHVREMVRVSQVTALPRMPEFIRGVINLRGGIIPLVDMRTMLGMQSEQVEVEELINTLLQREQDHLNWLDNLKKSVESRTQFTGALDPHKCAFGKWYDNFKTDNLLLDSTLKRFDGPHKAIHAIGKKVKEMQDLNDYEAAYAIIEKTRNKELALMINLFSATRELLSSGGREIAVVLTNGDTAVAVAADAVESVEKMKENTFEEPPLLELTVGSRHISAVARRPKNDAIVFLLDVERMLTEFSLNGGVSEDANMENGHAEGWGLPIGAEDGQIERTSVDARV